MRPPDAAFEEHRPMLERLAYRMLGSLPDADDIVQEAYLRWSAQDRSDVMSPRAYLSAVVTRLCIDRRQAIEERKTTYIGPWLPDPVVEPGRSDPAGRLETAESVSMALMLVLESLSPVERAAYLLRRIFDYGYDEIAGILGRSEVGCRQLVSRAEDRIQSRRPRFDPDPGEAERLTAAFLQACSSGDVQGLVDLLATDAVLYSDGGGKVSAALTPIVGADRIARLFVGILKKAPAGLEMRGVLVNGQPGLLALIDGQVIQVNTFDVVDGRIAACFAIRNPDKLARASVPSRDFTPRATPGRPSHTTPAEPRA
jgi:RNA polymerase sigma-70 factor (ECF subfamily)